MALREPQLGTEDCVAPIPGCSPRSRSGLAVACGLAMLLRVAGPGAMAATAPESPPPGDPANAGAPVPASDALPTMGLLAASVRGPWAMQAFRVAPGAPRPGLTAPEAGLRYQRGFWAWNAGPAIRCGHDAWVPFMSGYGGIVVAMFPNGMT